MKSIKRLAFLIHLQYTISKKGLRIGFRLLRFISRIRLINPLKGFNKNPSSKGDELRKVAEEIKPVLINIGETLAAQPQIVHETLKKVALKLHDKIAPSTKEQPITIIEQYNEIPPDESVVEFTPKDRESKNKGTEKGEGFEQHVKSLFDNINIAHFTGDKMAHQIESLVDKGLKYTKEWVSTQKDQSEYMHEESPTGTEETALGDFIHGIDELSLSVERLQAQVNQLMSGHEIN